MANFKKVTEKLHKQSSRKLEKDVESIGEFKKISKPSRKAVEAVEADDGMLTHEEMKAVWDLAPKHIQNYFAS